MFEADSYISRYAHLLKLNGINIKPSKYAFHPNKDMDKISVLKNIKLHDVTISRREINDFPLYIS